MKLVSGAGEQQHTKLGLSAADFRKLTPEAREQLKKIRAAVGA